MKRFIIGLFAFAVVAMGASQQRTWAQDYQTALGLNIGSSLGINFKQFVSKSGAVDLDLGYLVRRHGISLSGVYQHHISLVENFKLYVGGGVNVGVSNLDEKTKVDLGIDPNVGFEYKFKKAPVALAADYRPQINFFSSSRWGIAALKIRFVL